MSREFVVPADLDLSPPSSLADLVSRAWMVGAVGVALSLLGLWLDSTQFFRSYLVAWLFVTTITLGCFALGLLHQLTRGGWGIMLRRILGAATRTFPLLALGFIPIILGRKQLYPWARPEVVAHDELIQAKSWFLNVPGFIIRTAIYFAVWMFFTWALNRLSKRQDEVQSHKLFRLMQGTAAPGLVLYCLTATVASVDWIMSLDPHWYSSMFGVSFIGGNAVAAMAFLIPMALYLSQRRPMESLFRKRHFHDYGKLLLAFVMLWTYFQLSQLIIVWSGNLPEEVTWYLARSHGGWKWVSIALILGHFALPFLLLLSRDLKRDAKKLATVALVLLVMRWLDLYWQVAPAFGHGGEHAGLHLHWLDLATVLGVGGIWMAFYLHELRKRPLLPVHEPYLADALDEAEH